MKSVDIYELIILLTRLLVHPKESGQRILANNGADLFDFKSWQATLQKHHHFERKTTHSLESVIRGVLTKESWLAALQKHHDR